MALQPGLFYAYAKNINDDHHPYRYLIAFSSRKVADEWWRAVSDSVAAGHCRFATVERVSMQWYTHNPSFANIYETINDNECASRFRGQVMFTLLNSRDFPGFSVAPILNYTDHKSGQRFFIRSVLQPNLFWFYNPNDRQIRASTLQRTAFFIDIVGAARGNGEKIMIGSDKVSISVEPGRFLAIRQSGTEFYFSDFDGKFKREFVPHDSEMVITGQDPLGERWELVF